MSFQQMRPQISGNSAAIASLAVQKLAGKTVGTEQAARAIYLFKPDNTDAPTLLAEASRLAESAIGQSARTALEGKDPTKALTMIAAEAEVNSLIDARAGATEKVKTALMMGKVAASINHQPISRPIIIGIFLIAAMIHVATSDNEPEIVAGSLIAIAATLFVYGLIEWVLRSKHLVPKSFEPISHNDLPSEPDPISRPPPFPTEQDSGPTQVESNMGIATEHAEPSRQNPKTIGAIESTTKLPDASASQDNMPAESSSPNYATPQSQHHIDQAEMPAPPPAPAQDLPALAPPIPASLKTGAHHRTDLLDGNGQTIGPPLLWVGRADMLETLRLIQTVGQPRMTDEIVMSFDGSFLHFDLIGISTTIPAKGMWSCQVRVKPAFLNPLISVPLDDDPLLAWVKDGRIYFGPTFSCACEVQEQWQAVVQLPLNADEFMMLGVKLKYTPKEIEQSGLRDTVAKAEQTCCTRVNNAAKALAPYGISTDDIRALVDQSIRESGLLKKI